MKQWNLIFAGLIASVPLYAEFGTPPSYGNPNQGANPYGGEQPLQAPSAGNVYGPGFQPGLNGNPGLPGQAPAAGAGNGGFANPFGNRGGNRGPVGARGGTLPGVNPMAGGRPTIRNAGPGPRTGGGATPEVVAPIGGAGAPAVGGVAGAGVAGVGVAGSPGPMVVGGGPIGVAPVPGPLPEPRVLMDQILRHLSEMIYETASSRSLIERIPRPIFEQQRAQPGYVGNMLRNLTFANYQGNPDDPDFWANWWLKQSFTEMTQAAQLLTIGLTPPSGNPHYSREMVTQMNEAVRAVTNAVAINLYYIETLRRTASVNRAMMIQKLTLLESVLYTSRMLEESLRQVPQFAETFAREFGPNRQEVMNPFTVCIECTFASARVPVAAPPQMSMIVYIPYPFAVTNKQDPMTAIHSMSWYAHAPEIPLVIGGVMPLFYNATYWQQAFHVIDTRYMAGVGGAAPIQVGAGGLTPQPGVVPGAATGGGGSIPAVGNNYAPAGESSSPPQNVKTLDPSLLEDDTVQWSDGKSN